MHPNRFENASREGLLEVHSIDVGQGDATLIIGPDGTSTLVDVGVSDDAKEIISENIERRFQSRDDVDGLDNLVISHFDHDHANRAAKVACDYNVGSVYIPSADAYDPSADVTETSQNETELLSRLDASDEHDTSVYAVDTAGVQPASGTADGEAEQGFDLFSHEDANASALNPAPKETPGGTNRNSGSLGFSIEYGSTTAVLTSDASELAHGDEVEDQEIDFSTGYEHGSGRGSSPDMLRRVDSQHVHFSCDESKYDHPHDEMTDRISGQGMTATTTQEHGTTSWVTDGETYEVYTQRGEPVDGHKRSSETVNERLSGPSNPEPGYASAIPTVESPDPQYSVDRPLPGPDAAGELPSKVEDLADDAIEDTFGFLPEEELDELSEFFTDISKSDLEENTDINVEEEFEGRSEAELNDGFTVDSDEGISNIQRADSWTDIDQVGEETASNLRRHPDIDEQTDTTAAELENRQITGVGSELAERIANRLPLETDGPETQERGGSNDNQADRQASERGTNTDAETTAGTDDSDSESRGETQLEGTGNSDGAERDHAITQDGNETTVTSESLSQNPTESSLTDSTSGTEQKDASEHRDEGEESIDETETADEKMSDTDSFLSELDGGDAESAEKSAEAQSENDLNKGL